MTGWNVCGDSNNVNYWTACGGDISTVLVCGDEDKRKTMTNRARGLAQQLARTGY